MMLLTKRLTLLLCLLSAVARAHGGTIVQATIISEPQMEVSNGAVNGCGYRLKAIQKDLRGEKSVVILDTSFNFHISGIALLKGGAIQVEILNGQPGKKVDKPIKNFWLKVQSEKATTPKGGKIIPAASKGYLLYGVEFDAVMKLFDAIADETPVTIGMRLYGESVDRVFTGKVATSEVDLAEVQNCIKDLSGSFEELIKKDAQK